MIDQAVRYIVRPTRNRYHLNRLGPVHYTFTNEHNSIPMNIHRFDETIFNHKNINIELSVYINSYTQSANNQFNAGYDTKSQPYNRNSCVIYLHANNGSRVEGLDYLVALLKAGHNVCLLDFTGSGVSGGDYVTLGPQQASDLYFVTKFLQQKYGMHKFVLWGRSMGACAALIYSRKHPQHLSGMILDSPFKDLRKLVKELASQRTGVPKFLLQPLIMMIQPQLQQKIGKDFSTYKMKQYIDSNSTVPALFLVSKNDRLVGPHHTQKLYNRYLCQDKQLFEIDIQHHENRNEQIIGKCLQFIQRVLHKQQKDAINNISIKKGNAIQIQSIKSLVHKDSTSQSLNITHISYNHNNIKNMRNHQQPSVKYPKMFKVYNNNNDRQLSDNSSNICIDGVYHTYQLCNGVNNVNRRDSSQLIRNKNNSNRVSQPYTNTYINNYNNTYNDTYNNDVPTYNTMFDSQLRQQQQQPIHNNNINNMNSNNNNKNSKTVISLASFRAQSKCKSNISISPMHHTNGFISSNTSIPKNHPIHNNHTIHNYMNNSYPNYNTLNHINTYKQQQHHHTSYKIPHTSANDLSCTPTKPIQTSNRTRKNNKGSHANAISLRSKLSLASLANKNIKN